MERLYKSCSSEIKGLDDAQGVVEIYVNSFDFEDADGDVSAKGSFKKTIKENFNRIRHFLNHSMYNLSIGLPLKGGMSEDDFGLLVQSKMFLKNQTPREVFEIYKAYADEGRSVEHSIGYDVMKRGDPSDEEEHIIKEYRLWEYSTLSGWGANEKTPLVGIKSASDIEEQIMILKRVLMNDNLSHARLMHIEKSVQSLLTTIKTLDQPSKDTDKPCGVILSILNKPVISSIYN